MPRPPTPPHYLIVQWAQGLHVKVEYESVKCCKILKYGNTQRSRWDPVKVKVVGLTLGEHGGVAGRRLEM